MNRIRFIDLKPSQESFLDTVLRGLSKHPKSLPAKLFYDERGSKLFEKITNLPEYYPTRTELKLIRNIAEELGEFIPSHSKLIEFGSGSTEKIRTLIKAVEHFDTYVPIDISRNYLKMEAESLASDFPNLDIIAICADYTKSFKLPESIKPGPGCTGFFPGSTIGNMTPEEAVFFLQHAGKMLGKGAGFIIGVDLKKDPAILHAAYNDSSGITASFNMNVLKRINNELNGNFNLSKFRHRAIYNAELGRIEMHLVSLVNQSVKIGKQVFNFHESESIHTENSYKYNVREFQTLATKAGLNPVKVWWDKDELFSIHFLRI